MNYKDLKVGDKIRIIKMPGEGIPNYYLDLETEMAYEKLISRGRPVRISRIGADGIPCFDFKFKVDLGIGFWQYCTLCISESDNNWVLVKPKTKHS